MRGPRPNAALSLPPVSPNDPKPQKWLNPRAVEIFYTLIQRLKEGGQSTETHEEALNMCASRLARVEELNGKLDREGTTYETRDKFGNVLIKARPEFAQCSEAARHAAMLLSEMGLTPTGRARLRAPSSTKKKGSVAFDDL